MHRATGTSPRRSHHAAQVVTRLCEDRGVRSVSEESAPSVATSPVLDSPAHVIEHYNARQFNAAREISSVMTRRQAFFERLKATRRIL